MQRINSGYPADPDPEIRKKIMVIEKTKNFINLYNVKVKEQLTESRWQK